MLLTDGNPNETEDLRAYESAILSVANTEAIDLDTKLTLATEEVTQEVLEFLLDRAGGGDPRGNTRRQFGVADVVVTRQMKRWHVLRTLEIVYRDAFHNQLNDRYQAKFLEYKKLAADAAGQTFQFGVGLVSAPLPVGATPEFSFVAGSFEARTYYARVAWVGAAGQESAPSAVTTYDTPAGAVPVVVVAATAANAVGFNVYLGLTADSLTKQNIAPVAVGQAFTLPSSGLVGGVGPGDGQGPDVYVAATRAIRRG